LQKSCWYCHKPLSLFKSFKGDLFCDPEHERLYLSDQFKRVQDPFAVKATPAKAEPEPAPPAPQPAAASPVVEPASVEVVEVETMEAVEMETVELVAEPVRHSAGVAEPPVAPLFAWPVNAREGTRPEPVLEEAVDLVPERVKASRGGESIELRNTLPLAPLVEVSVHWSAGTLRQAAPEEVSVSRMELVRPRMGENSGGAITGDDDFPAAPAVDTPLRATGGTLPWVLPAEAMDLGSARIDPNYLYPTRTRRAAQELGLASRSRLELRARGAASGNKPSLPAGFSNAEFLNQKLSGQVPQRLSFGAAPQPEQTPALSGSLGAVDSLESAAGMPPGDAIRSAVALRLPQFAALGVQGALNWTAASPALFAPVRMDQIERELGSLETLLHKSLQLTLASVVALERSGVVGEAAGLGSAGFIPRDCGEPSEFHAATAAPESALVTPSLAPLAGPAGGLTPVCPRRTESYRAIGEMLTCQGSVDALSQYLSPPAKVALYKVQLTRAGTRCGGALELKLPGQVHECAWGFDWRGRDLKPAPLPAMASVVRSAKTPKFPATRKGAVSVGFGAARVAEQAVADSAQTTNLSVSAQNVQALDSRLPGYRGRLTGPRLQTGLAAGYAVSRVSSRVASKDAGVRAMEAFAQLGTLAGAGWPAASTVVAPAALREGSTVPLSGASVADGRVPEFSTPQKQLKVIPASLLGLPGPLPRNIVLRPAHGGAAEISIARAHVGAAADLEVASPIAVSAANPTSAGCFRTAPPALRGHSVILNFMPVPGDAPVGTHLADTRRRRRSASSWLAGPRAQTPQGFDWQRVPQETLL
jgi:hypothetical protein